MNLTNYRELQEPMTTKTIMKCSVRLDKKSMIQALGSDEITINNIRYLVPEEQLLHCLVNGIYGEIDLEFEEIKH
jgi:hypothetical protein